jgi:hypothetical protein
MAAMNRRHLIHALGLTLGVVVACRAVAEPGEVAVADFAMF